MKEMREQGYEGLQESCLLLLHFVFWLHVSTFGWKLWMA